MGHFCHKVGQTGFVFYQRAGWSMINFKCFKYCIIMILFIFTNLVTLWFLSILGALVRYVKLTCPLQTHLVHFCFILSQLISTHLQWNQAIEIWHSICFIFYLLASIGSVIQSYDDLFLLILWDHLQWHLLDRWICARFDILGFLVKDLRRWQL